MKTEKQIKEVINKIKEYDTDWGSVTLDGSYFNNVPYEAKEVKAVLDVLKWVLKNGEYKIEGKKGD